MNKTSKPEDFDAAGFSREVLAFYDVDNTMPEVVDEAELLNPQAIIEEARHHHPKGVSETIDLSFDK